MAKISFDLSGNGAAVLDRVVEAYGFTQKIQLADHLGIASSSLANRYKRNLYPADIVVKCVFETGASLTWLTTGKGKKFESGDLAYLNISSFKLVDGQFYENESIIFDRSIFIPGKNIPANPSHILDGVTQYIIDRQFTEVYDGHWLVEIEGKASIRNLILIPIRKVKVGSGTSSFDCNIDDIKLIGPVVLRVE